MNPIVPPIGSANSIRHKVYDLSIKDMDKRKKKAIVFESGDVTAEYLGMSRSSLPRYCVIGKRYYSMLHKKEFAIRIVQD